jgi:hypothetical protein
VLADFAIQPDAIGVGAGVAVDRLELGQARLKPGERNV